ncbi:MFS transporter [Bacillus massiliigorillae]|uniref:MFS transporter n=1 Tax=Bacillus massiliigorillae TaxID=1243664 RepID=UPI0003A50D64|nr:MFS transporter [Bacillus massiliigorillae]
MKNKYLPTAMAMYINYFVHGMGAIILAQNMTFLTGQLHTDKAGVAYVISALGIGRLIALAISGVLSDKFGRKPTILVGMIVYVAFFVSILFAPNVQIAFVFALLAGIANSVLDAGTYPALMESFPTAAGTANIIIKAFISAGQFLLPVIIGLVITNNWYWGVSFLIPVALLVLNAIFILKSPFPNHVVSKVKDGKEEGQATKVFASKPKFWVEGLAVIMIAFTATATFLIVQTWLPTYGEEVVGMTNTSALKLVSYYSAGSLASVFLTSYLVKSLIKPVYVVFVYPLMSLFVLLGVAFIQTPIMVVAGAFLIGFFAAGGVLQLGLVVMTEFFNGKKGTMTGIFMTMSSVASAVIPAVTGMLAESNVTNIIYFGAAVTFVGVLLSVVVLIRYRIVMKVENTKGSVAA